MVVVVVVEGRGSTIVSTTQRRVLSLWLYTRNRKRLPEAPLWRCMRFLEWCCSEGSQKEFFFAGREKTDDVWIGGGGSGGSGEYDCAHQTALYNTRNKKCLPESPLLLLVLFFRGRGSQGFIGWSMGERDKRYGVRARYSSLTHQVSLQGGTASFWDPVRQSVRHYAAYTTGTLRR